MNLLENEFITIRGDVEITEYENLFNKDGTQIFDENGRPARGKKIGHFEEKNIVLNQGKTFILQAFSEAANSDKTAKTIKIGNDVGVGTILAPQDPTASYTEANQSVVYTTPDPEFFVSYPGVGQVRFLATINGANVMSNYPTQPNIIYTSASLYTIEDKSVTYKRFPARTISSLISVDISWTLTLT